MIFCEGGPHNAMCLCRADLSKSSEVFSPAGAKLFPEEGVLGQEERWCVSVGILWIKYSPGDHCGNFWACFKSLETYLILV